MNNEYILLEVGKPFTMFKNSKMLGNDGAILELLESKGKGEWFIGIYLTNMSRKEELSLRNSKIIVKLIKETESFILPIMGYSDLTFSLIFDPLKYIDNRKNILFDITKINNMVTIVGIESTTNTIKTLRYANMPKKLYLALMQQYEHAKIVENFSEKYDRWIDDLYNRYTDEQLWQMGTYIGKMGE